MSISRKTLEAKLENVENKEEIINYIMSENGKSIESLREENEGLKATIQENESKYNDLVDRTKDYDEIKGKASELETKLNSYEEKAKNNAYFDVLRNAGYDPDFINEDIFKRIEKVEDINQFEANAKAYLKEKPKFSATDYRAKDNVFNAQALGNFDFNNASDEEIQTYLNKIHESD